mgnify:CR=1 FL=1
MFTLVWGGNSDGIYKNGNFVVSAIVLELVYKVSFSALIGMESAQLQRVLKDSLRKAAVAMPATEFAKLFGE